jgi:hypothetical protein
MNDFDQLTKEQLVEILSRGVITYDKNGLITLIEEWVQKCGISTFTWIPKSVHRHVAPSERYRPIKCRVLRKHFEAWVLAEKN